jgi:hypothetical protein
MNKTTTEHYKIGTQVHLGVIKATIVAVSIRDGFVTYEVSYISDNRITRDWVQECEFEILIKEEKKIGFAVSS